MTLSKTMQSKWEGPGLRDSKVHICSLLKTFLGHFLDYTLIM